MKKTGSFLILLTAIFTLTTNAQSEKGNRTSAANSLGYHFSRIWYAKAGANGDGSSEAKPFGSTVEVETTTASGNLIILLAGEESFEGGLALKDGQALIGLSKNGRKPVITNNDNTRNGGNGIMLSNNNLIRNIHIRNTAASGMFGRNVSGSRIFEVRIDSANQSGSFTEVTMRAMGGPIPHGGIILINARPKSSAEHQITDTEIYDAKAAGIASVALNAASIQLTTNNVKVERGDSLKIADVGITALAEGPASRSQLEIFNASVKGRMSFVGRNVIAFASAGASVETRINRSTIGVSGQDGVIAVAALLPAKVTVDISNSTIENAAQMNVEGTILDLPAFDSTRAAESMVSIDIEGSTIRNAGKVIDFFNASRNIWVGQTVGYSNSSSELPAGNYRLSIRNSIIKGSIDYGIGVGKAGSPPEKSRFDVLLRNNTITNNGSAALVISAGLAEIDARRNCWGTSKEFQEDRLRIEGKAKRSSLDVSEPLSCTDSDLK